MTIHVYPIDDWIEHDTEHDPSECNCPCDFHVQYLDDDGSVLEEPIIVHEAIDGREITSNK